MPHLSRHAFIRAKYFLVILMLFLLAGCNRGEPAPATDTATQSAAGTHIHDETYEQAEQATALVMPHIHGLGFSPDGQQLLVPAHDGLRIYRKNTWHIPDVPGHDYMGFTPANDGFYSSGHPHPSSNLVNPLGLVKSRDGGQTLVALGFEGESDFHFMAVGYENHAIYVANAAPNSTLQSGVYYSLDDGQSWQSSNVLGLTAQPTQMAVHPTQANVVGMATESGLFLSNDYANSFVLVKESGPITALTFHPDKQTLLTGYLHLFRYDLTTQERAPLPAPELSTNDSITYIAISPVNPNELAMATFNRDIYFSHDTGKNWKKIVEDGQAL